MSLLWTTTPFYNEHVHSYSKRWLSCTNLDCETTRDITQDLPGRSWFNVERTGLRPDSFRNERRGNCVGLDWDDIEELDRFANPAAFPEPETHHMRAFYANVVQARRNDLLRLFSAYRWVYNVCVQKFRTGVSLWNIKNEFMEDWLRSIPKEILDNSATEATNDLRSGRNKFKKKKSSYHDISIPQGQWSYNGSFVCIGDQEYFETNKSHSALHFHDAALKIVHTQDRFWLCVTQKIAPKVWKPMSRLPRIIAIDPGVRTFLTGYDPSGSVYEWARNDIYRILRLYGHADRLLARRFDRPPTQRARINFKNAHSRALTKIANLVDELHRKAVCWLVRNFDVIILPKLRPPKTLRGLPLRKLNAWKHYKFERKLVEKCRSSGVRVLWCCEAYTTMTCTECGYLQPLGSRRIFSCTRCKQLSDRDFQSCRNIFIKATFPVKPPV